MLFNIQSFKVVLSSPPPPLGTLFFKVSDRQMSAPTRSLIFWTWGQVLSSLRVIFNWSTITLETDKLFITLHMSYNITSPKLLQKLKRFWEKILQNRPHRIFTKIRFIWRSNCIGDVTMTCSWCQFYQAFQWIVTNSGISPTRYIFVYNFKYSGIMKSFVSNLSCIFTIVTAFLSSVHVTYYQQIAIKRSNIPFLIKPNKNETVRVFRNKLGILTNKEDIY